MAKIETLDILQEECAEVIQAVSKIRRFGWDSCHPDNLLKNNRDHLIEEMGDALALIELVVDTFELSKPDLEIAKINKLNKLKKWSTIFKE